MNKLLYPLQRSEPIQDILKTSIFLAGSIEMGSAEKWQDRLIKDLDLLGSDYIVRNPRREDWDSSWEQKISNPQFYAQVNWELDGLEKSTVVALYFDPSTKSPISLLELGLIAGKDPKKLVVYCPEGFWRKGNVDIVCQRYGIPVHVNYDTWVTNIKAKLANGKY